MLDSFLMKDPPPREPFVLYITFPVLAAEFPRPVHSAFFPPFASSVSHRIFQPAVSMTASLPMIWSRFLRLLLARNLFSCIAARRSQWNLSPPVSILTISSSCVGVPSTTQMRVMCFFEPPLVSFETFRQRRGSLFEKSSRLF